MGMKGTPGQEEALTPTWNWGEVTAEFIPLWHGKHKPLLRITMIPWQKDSQWLIIPKSSHSFHAPWHCRLLSAPSSSIQAMWCEVDYWNNRETFNCCKSIPAGKPISETWPLLWKLNLQNFQQKGAFWEQKYYSGISLTYITPCRINLIQIGACTLTNRNNLKEDHRWVTVSCF